MVFIEEVIQNLDHITGFILQISGFKIFFRFKSTISLSMKIADSPPEKPSRKERTALRLANDVPERIRLLKRYAMILLMIHIVTLLIGPWYAFITFIPVVTCIEYWSLRNYRVHRYFHKQSTGAQNNVSRIFPSYPNRHPNFLIKSDFICFIPSK